MSWIPEYTEASAAMQEGRFDAALAAVLAAFERMERGDCERPRMFFTMFLWSQLIEHYPPARDAMTRTRDVQLRRVLDGDNLLPTRADQPPQTRAALVVEMNEALGDLRSSYDFFLQLRERHGAVARSIEFRAVPAALAVGDFLLAEQLVPDPLPQLACVNDTALRFPLFPPTRTAPRLGAELSNFAGAVRQRAQALRGLGRGGEADALCRAALAGLANDELRRLAQAELDEDGAINRAITEHQVRLEEQEDADGTRSGTPT